MIRDLGFALFLGTVVIIMVAGLIHVAHKEGVTILPEPIAIEIQ